MKVGIIGSRTNKKISMVLFEKHIPQNCTSIVSGGAIGVDKFAEKFALKNSLALKVIVPNYEIFGKTAPLVRNTAIVEHSDRIIAFWDYRSRGTAHAIKECIRLNVAIEIVSINDIVEC